MATCVTPPACSSSNTCISSVSVMPPSPASTTPFWVRDATACRARSLRNRNSTNSSSIWTRPSLRNVSGTVIVTGDSIGRDWRDSGRSTSYPCCIIGAATMKMTSSTSITSTSGTTLISASELETRTLRERRRPPCRAGADGIGSSFGMSGEVALGDGEKLHREVVHFVGGLLHPVRDVVIEVDRRDCGEQPRAGGNERLGNGRRHDREARRSLGADALEGHDDAPHGAEQPDVGRDRSRRCEKRHPVLEFRDLDGGRPQQGAVDRVEAPEGWTRSPGIRPAVGRSPQLRVQLGVAGLEQGDEGARRERRAHGLHLGEPRAAAEDVEEGGALSG